MYSILTQPAEPYHNTSNSSVPVNVRCQNTCWHKYQSYCVLWDPPPVGLSLSDSTTPIMDVPNFILSVSELPINMPPKRGHCNDIESSSFSWQLLSREKKLFHIKTRVMKLNTVMCEVCSQILKSSETLKSHKKAMHENEKFICTDCG